MVYINKKLKIGVFGGARGKTMIDNLFIHPDAELVAVCDKYHPLLDNIKKDADAHNVKIVLYDNFDEFFNHDMDAVVLANYANEHAPYAVKFLKSGRHVMSEVLPSETMAQAVELIEAVESSGCVYSYAENYCYMTGTFEMWRRYRLGEIGEIMYAEGEYIHDCSAIWPQITYGERNHWRNRSHANFYCTHSLGPVIAITGLKPVSVVGFNTPISTRGLEIGMMAPAGIEMVTLENGAIVKSVHGLLKREPGSVNYQLFGQKGMMETGRMPENQPFNIYKESEKLCKGSWEKYRPERQICKDLAGAAATHDGSDFYPTHFFIQKILGRDTENYSIDVYQAADMGISGILAYRSVLNKNKPVEIPDLRIKEERDRYRNDNACTNPDIAGDSLLPVISAGNFDIPDSVYEKDRKLWKEGRCAE